MYFKQEKKSPARFTLPPISGSLHTPTPLPSFQQQIPHTISYSPYLDNSNELHKEIYYPVYPKITREWPEELLSLDNPKLKKRKDMNERMTRINQEFIDNKEIIYAEKLKQTQEDIVTIGKGTNETYRERLAELEKKRKKSIEDARLMMIYQIACVDREFDTEFQQLQQELMAEKKELQHTMFMLLEEKRKKLKLDKDGEGDFSMHETRHRKRLSRKKEEPKRKQDRLRDIPSHLMNVFQHRNKEEIEEDYQAMTKKLKKK